MILKCLKAEFIYSKAKVTSSPETGTLVSVGVNESPAMGRERAVRIVSLEAIGCH